MCLTGIMFHHTFGATAGAKASFLAAERYQVLMLSALALHPQKAVFKVAALEECFEFLLHEVRQRAFGLGHECAEREVVALYQLIEQRVFRLMALVMGIARKRVCGLDKRDHAGVLA